MLNSYAMLFFSNSQLFGAVILVASFFNPYTGIGGIAAVTIAIIAGYGMGFGKEQLKTGVYTYGALLLGLGMATFYEMTMAFWILISLAALLAVLLSTALSAKLGKNGLPALSLSFIFSLWVVMLASTAFSALGLTQRNIYWLNEMYAAGGNSLVGFLQKIDGFPLPEIVTGFLKSISAILFQSNIVTGFVLAVGMLFYSRIAFSLMVLGFATALCFVHLMGADTGNINYYNMGSNYMLVSVAIGGFFIIPSYRSYLWAIIMVPISYLLVMALGKITETWGLHTFSLPFCITVILFIYCLQLRQTVGKLVITPVQYFSPEINLYRYLNNRDRLMNNLYFHFSLPVMGQWMVSQGYDGSMTHKGEWSKALDFVVLDDEMKTYRLPGSRPEDFYCYNKPVLAPANGMVEEIIDHVDDNAIGHNNAQQNWGNTIVIKHAEGLYTQLSHLKKKSVKVAKGSFVKKGDVIASCGNSGRSPEPHLHFQVQGTPYIGSKTLAYPIAYFNVKGNDGNNPKIFTTPKEGEFVSNLQINPILHQAFNFQPGMVIKASENDREEEWEICTTAYNELYFFCRQTNSYAYFVNNGTVFYFTNFFGNKKSLLYDFYQTAYKILLSTEEGLQLNDHFPLNTFGWHPLKWLQDLVSPLYLFLKIPFYSKIKAKADLLGNGKIELESNWHNQLFGIRKNENQAQITVENGKIKTLQISSGAKTKTIQCS